MKRPVTEEIQKQIKKLYIDEEFTLAEVAATLNITEWSIRDSLAEQGLRLRTHKESRNTVRAKSKGYRGPRGTESPRWKGRKRSRGYILVWLPPNDFFRSMADSRGYVFEHRLVVARKLGRCLHRWEIVHHKDHIRDHNTDDNLQLVSDDRHRQITSLENRIARLEETVNEQRKQIKLLKWLIKQKEIEGGKINYEEASGE